MPSQTTTPNECANGCGYVPVGHKPQGWQCGGCDPARKTEHGEVTAPTFDGLAFTVATVRYNAGRYSATIRRDDTVYRARAGYNHATGGGARGARPAALKVFAKLLADNHGLALEGDYVAIPGDLDRETYTFTFVPKDLLR